MEYHSLCVRSECAINRVKYKFEFNIERATNTRCAMIAPSDTYANTLGRSFPRETIAFCDKIAILFAPTRVT